MHEVPQAGHRAAADTPALRRLRGGECCQQKLSPSAERGERWRGAQAPTWAPNEAAPGGSASLLPNNPTPHAPPTPFPASSVCRPHGPLRETQQGRRPAARTGGLAVGGHPHRGRQPTSTQHPGVSGAPPPRRFPTNSPRGAAPSPTSGRRPQRLRPRAPAHPGSGSAAGTGPPARGTFSSRPTTGVGRSHPETWLCRAGVEGETTAWGRGEGGGDTADQHRSRTGTIRAPGLAGAAS